MKITLLTWALSLFLYVTLAHSKEDMYLVTKVDGQTKKININDGSNKEVSFDYSDEQELSTYIRLIASGSDPLKTKNYFFVIFENNSDIPLEINYPDLSFVDADGFMFNPDTYEQYYVNAIHDRQKLIDKIGARSNYVSVPVPKPNQSASNSYYYSGTITSQSGEQYQSNGYLKPIENNFDRSYERGAAAGAILYNLFSAISNSIGAGIAKEKLKSVDSELALTSKYWIKDKYLIPPKSTVITLSTFTYRGKLPLRISVYAASRKFEFESVGSYTEAYTNFKKEN